MICKSCKKEFTDSMYLCPYCGTTNPIDTLQNIEFSNNYSKKVSDLMENIVTAEHTQISWDLTVDQYVQQMEQLKVILSQPEFSKSSGEKLIKRIGNFVERCKDPVFHIAFVGTIKAGKSTLINALLGRNLASTSVTPETAVLTKFRSSKQDYIKVTFYTSEEWGQLWGSISNNADVFKQEYADLHADQEKDEWIDHEVITKTVDNANIEAEIERWTSSKHVEHYFVKEVEIGLSDFNMPEQIVFVDTPGLDDAVRYRSDVTRAYIDRANAVFACVRSDALTGGELNTLYRIFSNSGDNPEKIFILGTQWDNLNNPEKDWKLQKSEWVKYLSTENCYGSAEKARKNIVHVAAYLQNLCRDYANTDMKKDRNKLRTLYSSAMKLVDIMPNEIEEHLDELIEKSNVSEVSRRITQDIIPRYKEYLMKDIVASYETINKEIKQFIEKELYGYEVSEKPMLSKTSEIAETVSIQNGAVIGDYTILSPGVSIGRNVKIGSHCVIGANTVIGDHCTIGDDVQIGTCCSIGTENFEYHKFQDEWRKIPAIGTVSIGNHVRIGGNVVIEKGTIGTTTIGDFTQIENLVQIGHEAKIGIQCHIVSLVAIAGWAEIGNYVDIYGQSAISNHVKIGDHSILLARS